MDRHAFIDLIANEKLAARYAEWTRRSGVERLLVADRAAAAHAPAPVGRIAHKRLAPPPRVVATHASHREAGAERVLSREALYELVWSEPITALAVGSHHVVHPGPSGRTGLSKTQLSEGGFPDEAAS
jgi:hypothetical protein